MDQKYYTLPLAPQDLVGIYKAKDETDDEYVLYVDYDATTDKLTDQHILIYLANTNFKTSFNKVTPSLLQEFIKSNFLVNCPMLSRVLAIIIRRYLDYELNDLEKILSHQLFNEEQIDEFIKLNGNLLEDLILAVQNIFAFTMWKIKEGTEDGKEPNLDDYVKDIEVTDVATTVGPNIARLVTEAIDVLYLVVHKRGITQSFNKQLYNDNPKYFGKDLFFIFNETNVVHEILKMLPEDFWHDSQTE